MFVGVKSGDMATVTGGALAGEVVEIISVKDNLVLVKDERGRPTIVNKKYVSSKKRYMLLASEHIVDRDGFTLQTNIKIFAYADTAEEAASETKRASDSGAAFPMLWIDLWKGEPGEPGAKPEDEANNG